jgi:hypothetical protein
MKTTHCPHWTWSCEVFKPNSSLISPEVILNECPVFWRRDERARCGKAVFQPDEVGHEKHQDEEVVKMDWQKVLVWEEEEELEYHDDLYSENYLEESFEDDSINSNEYGFMMGYLQEEDLEG